jgi:hypothetical protein
MLMRRSSNTLASGGVHCNTITPTASTIPAVVAIVVLAAVPSHETKDLVASLYRAYRPPSPPWLDDIYAEKCSNLEEASRSKRITGRQRATRGENKARKIRAQDKM